MCEIVSLLAPVRSTAIGQEVKRAAAIEWRDEGCVEGTLSVTGREERVHNYDIISSHDRGDSRVSTR